MNTVTKKASAKASGGFVRTRPPALDPLREKALKAYRRQIEEFKPRALPGFDQSSLDPSDTALEELLASPRPAA